MWAYQISRSGGAQTTAPVRSLRAGAMVCAAARRLATGMERCFSLFGARGLRARGRALGLREARTAHRLDRSRGPCVRRLHRRRADRTARPRLFLAPRVTPASLSSGSRRGPRRRPTGRHRARASNAATGSAACSVRDSAWQHRSPRRRFLFDHRRPDGPQDELGLRQIAGPLESGRRKDEGGCPVRDLSADNARTLQPCVVIDLPPGVRLTGKTSDGAAPFQPACTSFKIFNITIHLYFSSRASLKLITAAAAAALCNHLSRPASLSFVVQR